MINRTTLLTVIVCCIVSGSFAQDKWNLKRAVEHALANNISVKQADIQARLTELTYKQSKLNQYPTAIISADASINSGRSIDPRTYEYTNTQFFSSGIGFSTGVNVFNFFSLRNTIAGNRLDTEASRVNIERISNDIALNVATAYLQVLVAVEQVKIAEVAVQQTLQNMDNTSKRVEAGALPELNLAEIEAQLARDSTTLITAKATVRTNTLQLQALLNVDAAQPFEVETPPLDQIPVQPLGELEPETVYALALDNLPQQKMNNLRIEAARKFVAASKGQMLPSFQLFGNLGSQYSSNQLFRQGTPVFSGGYDSTLAKVVVNGTDYKVFTPVINTPIIAYRDPLGLQLSDNFRQNVGISVNIPLFNNGLARTALQRSKLNVQSLELQKDLDLLTLKQNIYTAYNDAVAAVQRFSSGRKGVETAEKAYNFAQKRYDLGLLSTIDLLTNQNNLSRAKVELALAHVDYVFRLKLLEFYKGQGLRLE
jgi:outer membrane protein